MKVSYLLFKQSNATCDCIKL